MQSQKLKLGLLLDSFQVPAWVYNSIQRVLNGYSGEFRLVVLNEDPDRNRSLDRGKWVYSIFNRIDEKLFTKDPSPLAPRSVHELLDGVPVVRVCPVETDNNSCCLNETDAGKIKDHELDILIKFGFDNLQCESLNVARYGIWFYYFGDEREMRGGPPGFWEVVENSA